MERYARWVVDHARLVVAGIIGTSIVLTVGAARLRVEVDPDKQLPQDHAYIQTLNEVYRLFGDKNLVVVGLFPNDGQVFTPAFLARLDDVTRRLGRLEGVNPDLLLSLASPNARVIHGTRDEVSIERVMPDIPTTPLEADAVRARAFANDTYVGTLIAADGSAAAIHASFELNPVHPDHRALHRSVLAALREADDGTFTYRLAGPVVMLSQLSSYSSRMVYLFPLALLVIGLVHYDAFRTFQGLFLPLLTALLAVLWSLGLMGWIGVPLDPLNTTTAVLVLAVAAGHAVQVLKRFYEDYDRRTTVEDAVVLCLRHVGPVMLGAGAVATLSFWSLATFGTASIRTFGLFTGLGIASALIIEMTLIPALRVLLPAPRTREREREAASHPMIDGLLRAVFRVVTSRRRIVAMLTFAVAAGGVLGAAGLRVDTSLKREFRTTDPSRVDDEILNSHFSGTNTLIALVEGTRDGALEEPAIIRAIDGLQQDLMRDPSVGKAYSYVDVVRQIHAAFTADDAATGRLPSRADMVAQYLFLHSTAGEEGLRSILDDAHRTAKVRVLVHDDSTRHGEMLIARARRYVREQFPDGYDVRFTGTLASNAATTEVMVEGKLRNIAQITAVTIAVSAWLLRSLLGGLLVVLPLALTVVVNFGVMGWLGIPLDMVTSALSAMAVGIGADYAMYLLFRIREETALGDGLEASVRRALSTSGKAVVFVSSAVAAGYATLCLSGFGVHVQLGSLVALAMIVSAASALVLLPSVILAVRPAFIVARGRERAQPSGIPVLPLDPVPAHHGKERSASEVERQLA